MSDGVNGESVMSMHGVGDVKQVNSAVSSVKMVASSVFMTGPAGYQGTFGGVMAFAGWTVGRWKLEDIGPGRLARDNTTAETNKNRMSTIVPTKFLMLGSSQSVLKAYPNSHEYLKKILSASRK